MEQQRERGEYRSEKSKRGKTEKERSQKRGRKMKGGRTITES
jgi:hypothetical protein